MLQPTLNYCLVEIERKFQDEKGGIFIDTSWFPEQHATLEGTIISTPMSIESNSYRNIITPVIAGDKIVFSYSVIFDYVNQPDNDTPIYKNLMVFEGKEYWKVDVGEIFCKVVAETFEMVTDNLLLKTFHGETKLSQGIEIKENNERLATVVAIPKNIRLSCKVIDLVLVEEKYLQKYVILGQEYMIIPSRRVIAKAA